MSSASASSTDKSASACPVDHNARRAWVSSQSLSASCDSKSIDQTLPADHPPLPPSPAAARRLATEREISSIPRVDTAPSNSEHAAAAAHKAAAAAEAAAAVPGNWIYPSEEMFFNAMKRKSWDPKAEDMRTIVPIHNAVNERAWAEIRAWEAGRGSEACGGPKLVSFSGDSQKLTPKARFLTLLGYHPPFDRHDWTVDRCGKRIDYVIDFYSGKRDPAKPQAINFYLDVRPKLTPEGAYMRLERWVKGFF